MFPFPTRRVFTLRQRERLSAFTLLSNFRSPVSGLRSPVSKFSTSYFAVSTSQRERRSAFTLLEILVVIGIIAILMVLIAPAFTSIKTGNNVTSAAYTIKGVLDQARTYAMANNTYTWVGFYEENGSNPSSPISDAPATGRVVISIVASKDGTMMYTAQRESRRPCNINIRFYTPRYDRELSLSEVYSRRRSRSRIYAAIFYRVSSIRNF